MTGDKSKKGTTVDKKSAGTLIETLPDGRHRTNLSVLIRTDEARLHFKEISKIVKREKSAAEVK
jgi:hypothetical protein